MPKNHSRDFFYKYATYATGTLIMTDLTARYNSPLLFNDPFDAQMELRPPWGESDNPWLLITDEIERRVLQEAEPEGTLDSPLYSTVIDLRKKHSSSPFADMKAEIQREGMTSPLHAVNANKQEMLDDLRKKWSQMLPHLRIFCVSEVCDDLLMWAHYGESHQGIVIKFRCLPKKDNALCLAQPVSYSETIPYLITIKDMVDRTCGFGTFDDKEYFRKRALTKSPHWCYEKEWRVIDFDPQIGQDRFTDHLIHPEEIDSVYLGCRMDDYNRQAIWRLVYTRLPHVKIFQATPDPTKFKLTFDQVR